MIKETEIKAIFHEKYAPITYVEGTNIESVEHSRSDYLLQFALYDYIINTERIHEEFRQKNRGRLWKSVDNTLNSGRFDSVSDAVDYLKAKHGEGAPLYKQFGYEEPDEAVSDILLQAFSRADYLTDAKEPQIREGILPYIEAMLIAGMKAKRLPCTWIRLSLYGFSVEPFDWSKAEVQYAKDLVDFPYSSVQDMKEKDREAFQKTALDVYYEIQSHALAYHTKRVFGYSEKTEDEEKRNSFYVAFPKEGLTREELVSLFEKDYKEETGKDGKEDDIIDWLGSSWETETLLELPILYARYDEAVYYALRYEGEEYKKYLSSLDAVKDWEYSESDN